jgi:Sec-independent protein translocase protein TatA
VFGLSFGEFIVLLLVAIVVLGPKELGRHASKAGRFMGRARDTFRDIEDDRSLIASVLAVLAVVAIYLLGRAVW